MMLHCMECGHIYTLPSPEGTWSKNQLPGEVIPVYVDQLRCRVGDASIDSKDCSSCMSELIKYEDRHWRCGCAKDGVCNMDANPGAWVGALVFCEQNPRRTDYPTTEDLVDGRVS